MQRIKSMLRDDSSAVSPVIGVILMVAITVILAAVIASFVLGLGDQGEPAPSPTIESDVSAQTLNLSVTGGDDFDATVSSVQASVTINDTANDETQEVTFNEDLTASGQTKDASFSASGDTITVTYNGVPNDEVTAGDELGFGFTGASDDYEIESWDVEIVWNPSDQDSTVIYDDSS